jgi:membrane-bound metal-dependent hydrolase YbcI (DUF457 family)
MTGTGHTLTGLLGGIPLAALSYHYGSGVIGATTIVAMTTLGSTAPDWLEVPYKSTSKDKNGNAVEVTKRLLKHRGVTHIFVIWLAAFLWAFCYLKAGHDITGFTELPIMAVAMIFGFCGGGVLHLLGDIPNKQKVPIFTPFDGIALNLWKSGNFERTTGGLLLAATIAFVYYEQPIFDTIHSLI